MESRIKMDLSTILNLPEAPRKAKVEAPSVPWKPLLAHRLPPTSSLTTSIDNDWSRWPNQQYSPVIHDCAAVHHDHAVVHHHPGHMLANLNRSSAQYSQGAQRCESHPRSPEHSPRVIRSFAHNQELGRRHSSDSGRSRQHSRWSTPHSNRPYTRRQVFFLRYFREDCGLQWSEVLQQFQRRWPEDLRESNQSMSARYYRDNIVPRLDHDGNIMFDSRGQVLWDSARVRDRLSEDGQKRDIPVTLVDLYPEKAMEYDWVKDEHKAIARNILQGIDPSDHDGKKAFWRKIFRTVEALT